MQREDSLHSTFNEPKGLPVPSPDCERSRSGRHADRLYSKKFRHSRSACLDLTPLLHWLLFLVPIYPASYCNSTNRIAGFIILDYNIQENRGSRKAGELVFKGRPYQAFWETGLFRDSV